MHPRCGLLLLFCVFAREVTSWTVAFARPRLAKSQTLSSYQRNAVRVAVSTRFLSSTDLPEREIEEVDEEVQRDLELENKLALDQYNALKGDSALLLTSTFLRWDEILDVLEYGVLDVETIDDILVECDVKQGFMTFEQFKEVVTLINDAQLALEQEEFDDPSQREGLLWEVEEEEEEAGKQQQLDRETEMRVQELLAGLGMKKRQPKP